MSDGGRGKGLSRVVDLLPHGNDRPGSIAPGSTTVASHRYTDSDFLAQEYTRVFRRAWLMACPRWRLQRPGDRHVFDAAERSVLLVVGDDHRVRAFHNQCLHRGSRLVDSTRRRRDRAQDLRCAYHGWTYRLDGQVVNAPRADGFSRCDPNQMRLRPIACQSWAGMVWINLGPSPPPLMDTLGGLADELAPYQIEQMEPIEERNFRLPVNWKAGLENVTDYYHVSTVHQRTVHAHVRDGPDLTRLGDHTRQTLYIAPYAWRRKLDVYCSRGGPYTEKQQSQLHKYLIFPNLVLNVLPYHLTLMQWWPVTPRSSRLRYAFCLRRGAGTVERARAWLSWAYSRVVLHEDIGVLAALQAGLDASPPTEQPLHDEEAAAAHFHGVLDRWMESPE